MEKCESMHLLSAIVVLEREYKTKLLEGIFFRWQSASKWKVAYVIEKRIEQCTGKIVFESRWIAMASWRNEENCWLLGVFDAKLESNFEARGEHGGKCRRTRVLAQTNELKNKKMWNSRYYRYMLSFLFVAWSCFGGILLDLFSGPDNRQIIHRSSSPWIHRNQRCRNRRYRFPGWFRPDPRSTACRPGRPKSPSVYLW